MNDSGDSRHPNKGFWLGGCQPVKWREGRGKEGREGGERDMKHNIPIRDLTADPRHHHLLKGALVKVGPIQQKN